MQWKERCLCVCVWLFCSMLLLICQLKQNFNKFVTCSNLWRQNTTLLLIFPVREIRYYPSIECMTFDMLSRLNIIEHQFTRVMLKTWKVNLHHWFFFTTPLGCFMLSPGPLQFEATLPVAFECIGYLEHVSDSAHSGLLDLKPGNSQVMFSVEKNTYLAMIYFKWPPFCGVYDIYEFCEPSRGNVRKEGCDTKVSDMSCMLKDALI